MPTDIFYDQMIIFKFFIFIFCKNNKLIYEEKILIIHYNNSNDYVYLSKSFERRCSRKCAIEDLPYETT